MTDPTPSVAPREDQANLPPPHCPGSDPGVVRRSLADASATLDPTEVSLLATGDARAPAGYVLQEELGRGGMGVVYKARSLTLQRTCALKMILSGVHFGDAEDERFRTEAQAIARLQHPNIVQVFEIGKHDGKPFMALEFCGGGPLDGVLAKNPLKPREAATLVKTLAEAIQTAHQALVIHRDLKPANVLLTETGEPKVSDFGLARKLDEEGMTRSGSVLGTPSYMPPEQAAGRKDIGPAADVYALGAILYECLASRPPFRAATAYETIVQVLNEEPVPLRQLNHVVPADLETIAHKCLQKDPAKRYATAQALADDLGRYLNDEPIVARPVGLAERAVKWVRRNAVVSALMAAVLLVLLTGVAVSSWFAFKASEEASAARKAEKEAQDRAEAEAEARANAQRQEQRAQSEKDRAEKHLDRVEGLVYAGKLALAQQAFKDGEGALALRYLGECQWNRRGWEHRHLWTRFNSKQTFRGHMGDVISVAFSPDGRRIVTGSTDMTAKVWDAQAGREILTLKGHKNTVNGVAFSPDGRRIVTGSWDSTAKVWDAEKGQEVFSLKGHTKGVNSMAFSPDGNSIVTGSVDGTAKVWNAQMRQEVLTIQGRENAAATSVAFSPNSKWVVVGCEKGDLVPAEVKVWDIEKGQELFTIKEQSRSISSVAFSSDGKRVFAWDEQNNLLAWCVTDAQPAETTNPPVRPRPGPARSPSGFLIATPQGISVTITDTRLPPNPNTWPLPQRAERQRYHREQASLAEKNKQWFAAAFHLGRLLLDAPEDLDLKRRHQRALQNHASD